MMRRIATIVVLAALPAAAGTPPKSADWTGYYTMARGKDLAGFKPLNMDLNSVVIAHLQPWALAKMEATDGVADDTGGVCQPDGIFRYPAMAGSFLWLPAAGRILMVFGPEALNTAGVQRIYLNRKHPKNVPPTWNGDSIGHWEGDTLVVDTTGFNDKSWLFPGREPHTEEAHMVQQIRRVGDGSLIEVNWRVEDRQALTSAYTYSRYYKKVGDEMGEEVCSDDLQIWKDFRNKRLLPALERSREAH